MAKKTCYQCGGPVETITVDGSPTIETVCWECGDPFVVEENFTPEYLEELQAVEV